MSYFAIDNAPFMYPLTIFLPFVPFDPQVYGRDPVLTCEYAYFLTIDNHCPYANCYLEALKEMREHPQNHTSQVIEMVPANWMNCSSEGYIP